MGGEVLSASSCAIETASRIARRGVHLGNTQPRVEVPVQYFQSVIAIELAVAGALLWQVRFFESSAPPRQQDHLPDPRLRLVFALVLGATVFGSLFGMANEGETFAAIGVTVGLAVSVLPILLRVLPPLVRDATTQDRDPNYAVSVIGLVLYILLVVGVIALLSVE
jgi:hypothetical protein